MGEGLRSRTEWRGCGQEEAHVWPPRASSPPAPEDTLSASKPQMTGFSLADKWPQSP